MKQFSIRSIAAPIAVAIGIFVIVPFASARTERETTATSTTIQVTAREYSFKLSTSSLAKPGTVTFNLKNVGHIGHDLKINGKATPIIGPGKTVKLNVVFKKKGSYPYLCTVPGHAALGMKGVFTVR
jgi:uncharacterized cupredoxin-like copper-binding protein